MIRRESYMPSASSFLRRLFGPIDVAGLVYFRIVFYAIMLWEVWRFIDHGRVERYYTGKPFYFTYWPFDFLRPLPADGMEVLFWGLGLAALFAALGLFYRVSAAAFFLMITYVFLLEKAQYLNHLYLVCLISFLMVFVPSHRHFSLDALMHPHLRSDVAPAWSLWLLRFQVGIPMFFGGIAKLNSDWLRGEPLRIWLADRTDFPVIGRFFTDEPVVWLMAYWALLLDLLVVFLLLHRRTRVFAFLAILHFHFTNSRLFDIGIFPWLMIAATVVFFDPEWPRRLVRDLRQRRLPQGLALLAGFEIGFFIGGNLPQTFSPVAALIGGLGGAVGAYHLFEPFSRKWETMSVGPHRAAREVRAQDPQPETTSRQLAVAQRWAVASLVLWVAFQVLMPLRHLAIPGNVHWTEEGHVFSWHMKLRDKGSDGTFLVSDPATGLNWTIDPLDFLTLRQSSKMLSRPEMAVQFAQYLEDVWRQGGYEDVEVRARIYASLNGRVADILLDPDVDLTEVPRPWFGHAEWILPLEVPLTLRQ